MTQKTTSPKIAVWNNLNFFFICGKNKNSEDESKCVNKHIQTYMMWNGSAWSLANSIFWIIKKEKSQKNLIFGFFYPYIPSIITYEVSKWLAYYAKHVQTHKAHIRIILRHRKARNRKLGRGLRIKIQDGGFSLRRMRSDKILTWIAPINYTDLKLIWEENVDVHVFVWSHSIFAQFSDTCPVFGQLTI